MIFVHECAPDPEERGAPRGYPGKVEGGGVCFQDSVRKLRGVSGSERAEVERSPYIRKRRVSGQRPGYCVEM